MLFVLRDPRKQDEITLDVSECAIESFIGPINVGPRGQTQALF